MPYRAIPLGFPQTGPSAVVKAKPTEVAGFAIGSPAGLDKVTSLQRPEKTVGSTPPLLLSRKIVIIFKF